MNSIIYVLAILFVLYSCGIKKEQIKVININTLDSLEEKTNSLKILDLQAYKSGPYFIFINNSQDSFYFFSERTGGQTSVYYYKADIYSFVDGQLEGNPDNNLSYYHDGGEVYRKNIDSIRRSKKWTEIVPRKEIEGNKLSPSIYNDSLLILSSSKMEDKYEFYYMVDTFTIYDKGIFVLNDLKNNKCYFQKKYAPPNKGIYRIELFDKSNNKRIVFGFHNHYLEHQTFYFIGTK